ncbi:MAG: SRPBCC family protein [Alphaproteobacteria bacterium]|nr:SRPBCC family protein [Alphaproteobacteria bacterium]
MRAVHEVIFGVPMDRVLTILTTFEDYPDFLPSMVQARVLSREERVWEVAFRVDVIRPLDYTLRLTLERPDPAGVVRLRWSLVEGVFRSNEGGWTLTPIDGGARTHARYEIDVQVGVYVPGTIVNTLVERTLPATLEAFRTRAERPLADPTSAPSP